MPRPYPPPLIGAPTARPFTIGEAEERDIARVLGLRRLPPKISSAIAEAISAYQATAVGSSDTTVGNTIAALRELKKKNRAYKSALVRLADDRFGVDYTTHDRLQTLAKAVLLHKPGAANALDRAVNIRICELNNHKRVDPRKEVLRFFCGCLRLIFNEATHHLKRNIASEEAWQRCRRFAMEIFAIAGIEHANFLAHPERLTEFLGTDVSIC
jgi:hypothetical protein